MRVILGRVSALLAATALTLSSSACSDDATDGDEGRVVTSGGAAVTDSGNGTSAADVPDLSTLDLFLMAEAEGNVLQADLYGVKIDEGRAHRLTTGKRISYVSASEETVVVAAADQQVDRLAVVGPRGALGPVPGLGRPDGFTPVVQASGSILYQTFRRAERGDLVRFHSWDPDSRQQSVFFRTRQELEGPVAGPRDRVAFLERRPGVDRVIVREPNGRSRSFRVAEEIGDFTWKKNRIAVTEVVPGSDFGTDIVGTVLLDPDNGKTIRVPGWQPIAWSPYPDDALLVRKVSDGPDTVLALLDPDNPKAEPLVIATLPGLRVFQGAWAGRDVLPRGLVIPDGEGGEVASSGEVGVVAGDPDVRRGRE